MPLLKEYKKAYEDYSSKASDINRNLCLAGIAIIWLFKVTAGGTIILPWSLAVSGAFIVVGMILDLGMYFYSSKIWRDFYDRKYESVIPEDDKTKDDVNVEADEEADKGIEITDSLYHAKFVATAFGFLFLGVYFFANLILS